MLAANLTINEAAELSGVSQRSIEKAAEEGIVTKKTLKGSLRPIEAAHVPVQIVVYASVMKRVQGISMDIKTKKRLFRRIKEFGEELGAFEHVPGLTLSVDTLAGDEWSKARLYVKARDAYLESRKEVFGGEPVIKGTRITCRSVLGKLQGGETINDLIADYPGIPRKAFEAAVTYAKTHPRRGRPSTGKSWRQQTARKPVFHFELNFDAPVS